MNKTALLVAGAIGIAAAAWGGGAYYTRSTYERERLTIVAIGERWQDAVTVAHATSRVAMAAPLASLQTVRRDLDAADLSECMDKARDTMTKGMDLTIEGFVAFARNNAAKNDEFWAGRKIREGSEGFKSGAVAAAACAPS